MEIWKDIPRFIGLYQVSDLGRVKSLKRKWVIKEFILTNTINSNGYFKVKLTKNGIGYNIPIHRLVASAFLNYTPNGTSGLVSDHIDENKLNNNLSNIQLITNRENVSKSKNKSKTYSKYIGVTYDKSRNKWTSSIYINKRLYNLGRFKNEYDAHLMYQKVLNSI